MIDVYCVNVGTKYTRDFDRRIKDAVAKQRTIEQNFNSLKDKHEKQQYKGINKQ